MDTSTPNSSSSITVNSPSKMLPSSPQNSTNHRTTPLSKIPQPVSSSGHMSLPSDVITNQRLMNVKPSNLPTIKPPGDFMAINKTSNVLQKVGNGPVAMISEPQQALGQNIVQPIITRGNPNLPTVVTVEGPISTQGKSYLQSKLVT